MKTARPILLDLSHTAHTRAQSGIQHVARSLRAAAIAAGRDVTELTFDPHARRWRTLRAFERANLDATAPAASRKGRWPLTARWLGRWQRLRPPAPGTFPADAALIAPEIFSPEVGAAYGRLFPRVGGPRVAIFHDAIALRLPELTPARTVARFPAYLHELLAFDRIAAVSADSRDALRDWWRWCGVAHPPPVAAIPLGVRPPATAPHADAQTSATPVVLSVGSIEGRKNHLALLDACEALWSEGHVFRLHLIGLAHPQTGRAALERVRALTDRGRPLDYAGAVDAATLERAYAACTFTIYPSLMEGFGLPVIESVARGKPCVCLGRGALAEAAAGGGCVTLADVDATTLTDALRRLLTTPTELATLSTAARARPVRTWADYTRDLLDWIDTPP